MHKNKNGFGKLFPSIDNVMNEVMRMPVSKTNYSSETMSSKPKANIIEHENKYEIAIAMPGFSKKDISIELEKNQLTVSANKEDNKERKYNLKEFSLNNMKRVFKVPSFINREDIKAELKNGILMIQLLKSEEVQPKTIAIK